MKTKNSRNSAFIAAIITIVICSANIYRLNSSSNSEIPTLANNELSDFKNNSTSEHNTEFAKKNKKISTTDISYLFYDNQSTLKNEHTTPAYRFRNNAYRGIGAVQQQNIKRLLKDNNRKQTDFLAEGY